MLEEVSEFSLPTGARKEGNLHRRHRPFVLLALLLFSTLWSLPLVLASLGLAWPTQPFPHAWELLHGLVLFVFSGIVYLALDSYPNQDVRDHAIPLTLFVGAAVAFAMEWLGPPFPQPFSSETQWLHPFYFTADTLGITALALTAAPVRVLQGRPALRPLSTAERERTLHLLRTSFLNTRAILAKPLGLLGALILVVLVIVAAVGPLVIPYDVAGSPYPYSLPPSAEHPLGTDGLGQDLLAEVVHSLRYSLLIGLASAVVAGVVGTWVGLYSGYVGGRKDEVIMRLNDILLSVPLLILLIELSAILRGRMTSLTMVLIMAFFGWSYEARIIRAQAMSIKERPFVERARAQGAGGFYIMRKHILPLVLPVAVANFVISVSGFILLESTLAFLHLVPQTHPSLGSILDAALANGAWTNGRYLWILVPGLILVAATSGFGFLGHAMEDILNPRLKKR